MTKKNISNILSGYPRVPGPSGYQVGISSSLTLNATKTVQGRVVQKPVNANPGLKVNRSINFSCIKMFLTAYVLRSLRLFKLKTEGRII